MMLRRGFYITTVIGLILLMCTLVGLPFGIIGLIYINSLRKEALQGADQLNSAHEFINHQQSVIEQVGAMDIHQHQEHLNHLNAQLHHRTTELDDLQHRISTLQMESEKEIQKDQARANKQLQATRAETLSLKSQILNLEADVEINDFGLYNFEKPAQDFLLVGQELKTT